MATVNNTPHIGQAVGNMYGNTGYIYEIEDQAGNVKTFAIDAGLQPITKKIKIVYTDRPGFSDISEYELDRYIKWSHGAESVTPEQVADFVKQAKDHTEKEYQARQAAQQAKEQKRADFVATYGPKVPTWAKAVIIAQYREDESDLMSDYHGHSVTKEKILAFSTHTRDLFPEMRKAALNSSATAFLYDATESYEHREKYSMGGGYYLAKSRHSGWSVSKHPITRGIESLPTGEWCVPEAVQQTTAKPTTNTTNAHIEQHTHTKKGFLMHIVVLDTRVDRATFLEYAETAKSLGGWYSKQWGSTPGGFAFLEASQADQFIALISGTPPDDNTPKPTKGNGEKFRTMADKLTNQIADKLADRLTNTPKRLAQANHARLEGERLKRTQEALYKLADLHDAGSVPVELKGITTKQAVYDLLSTKLEPVQNCYHSYHVCTGKPRLETPEALALWSLITAKTEAEKADDEYRRKLEGLQFSSIPGYFPTPKAVVERMIQLADIEPSHKVLEPSAGHGAIVDGILSAGVPWQNITLVEYNATLASILAHKYRLVYPGDFLEKTAWEIGGPFDRIIMNPPFEKGQDIKHIKHAITMLKPGGILVGICSGGTKQTEALQPLADSWEILPAGTFKESGTNVQSVLFTVRG